MEAEQDLKLAPLAWTLCDTHSLCGGIGPFALGDIKKVCLASARLQPTILVSAAQQAKMAGRGDALANADQYRAASARGISDDRSSLVTSSRVPRKTFRRGCGTSEL